MKHGTKSILSDGFIVSLSIKRGIIIDVGGYVSPWPPRNVSTRAKMANKNMTIKLYILLYGYSSVSTFQELPLQNQDQWQQWKSSFVNIKKQTI